ncbi:MAG: hypothetical protein ACAH06_08455, partial [Methylophilaceae bacterium]
MKLIAIQGFSIFINGSDSMKSIQLRGIVAAVSGALLLGAAPLALADSTDDIINALIGKGVLTEEEGALLQKGRAGEKEAAEKK